MSKYFTLRSLVTVIRKYSTLIIILLFYLDTYYDEGLVKTKPVSWSWQVTRGKRRLMILNITCPFTSSWYRCDVIFYAGNHSLQKNWWGHTQTKQTQTHTQMISRIHIRNWLSEETTRWHFQKLYVQNIAIYLGVQLSKWIDHRR